MIDRYLLFSEPRFALLMFVPTARADVRLSKVEHLTLAELEAAFSGEERAMLANGWFVSREGGTWIDLIAVGLNKIHGTGE